MVFCYQNCSDLYCEKKLFLWLRKIFDITITIYLNSDRSEQYLKLIFFNLQGAYHIELVQTKWLWGVEGSIILLNYGA